MCANVGLGCSMDECLDDASVFTYAAETDKQSAAETDKQNW